MGTSDMYETTFQSPEKNLIFNRFGPNASRLTPDAVLRKLIEGEGFIPAPQDIAVYWTNDWDKNNNTIYVWVPWHPNNVPAELTENTNYHGKVKMTDAEYEEEVRKSKAK